MPDTRFYLSLFRRLAGLLLLGGLLASAGTRAETVVTLLTDDSYPPYSYKEKERAAGIYPDILRAAESQLKGYRLKLVPVPYKRALAEVEAGLALAVVPPYYRPVERPWIGPYSVPMLEERVVVFCREDIFAGNPRLRWPDDYHGLLFGNNSGFTLGGPAFWGAVQQGLIRLEEAPGSRTNLLKLVNKRVDCYLNDRLSVLSELAQMRREKLYDEARHGRIQEGATVSVENGHVGYTNRDNGRFAYKTDFVRQLDAAIAAMRQSGRIQQIVNRYVQ